MLNYKLIIQYDGTRYKGWQKQKNTETTIQGKIETALTRILGEPVEISGSGRTDAGVHARLQVASFHCSSTMKTEEILAQLRRYLPEDIGIYSCREVQERFHARLHAVQKTYCYRIWNSDAPCVFRRRYVTVLPDKLDISAMRQAGACFLGSHDFSAFTSSKGKKKSNVRNLFDVKIERVGEEIRISFTGDGFLYNMVRIMAGTLVEVGLGLRDPDSVKDLFGEKREKAGRLMPAQGLCLMEVVY